MARMRLGSENRRMKPSAWRWSYTSSSPKVAKAWLYSELGLRRRLAVAVPLYRRTPVSPVSGLASDRMAACRLSRSGQNQRPS